LCSLVLVFVNVHVFVFMFMYVRVANTEELSKAAEDMDQSSDLLAQQLVHKDISVDQFVQQYCLQRENFHRRTMVMQTLN